MAYFCGRGGQAFLALPLLLFLCMASLFGRGSARAGSCAALPEIPV
jgi:hypothetical protein